MLIKVNPKAAQRAKGFPRAQVAVSPGENSMGAPEVMFIVNAVDTYDMLAVVGTLHMNPSEARDLAARLAKAADDCPPDRSLEEK